MISRKVIAINESQKKTLELARLKNALCEQYDAYVFDVDGTLNYHSEPVPIDVIENLVTLLACGKYVAIASGRPFIGTQPPVLFEHVYRKIDSMIDNRHYSKTLLDRLIFATLNGTLLVRASQTTKIKNLVSQPLFASSEQKQEIIHALESLPNVRNTIDKGLYMTTIRHEADNPCEKHLLISEIQAIFNSIKSEYKISDGGFAIDVNVAQADKSNTLEYLTTQCSISSHRIASIGDSGQENGNDYLLTNRKGGFSVDRACKNMSDQINVPLATDLCQVAATRYLIQGFINNIFERELSW